jgi:hypothetical protein
MSTVFETGHSKNVANLLKYEQFLATLGVTYNPSNVNITVSAFTSLYINADAKVNSANTIFTDWKNNTNQRELIFKELKSLSTKLLGALQSTGTAKQTIDDFAFLVKKFRGSSKKKTTNADAGRLSSPSSNTTNPAPSDTPIPNDPNSPSNISTSQQSFDNRIQHFSKMILLLQSQPIYSPNETQYQVPNLQAKLATITTLNDNANSSYANLRAARIDRNTFLYAENTGMLDLIKQSKAYIKSIYGANSQQYHTANSIKFVRVINKNKAN